MVVNGTTRGLGSTTLWMRQDPQAFCILSTIYRADDDWNPDAGEPWASYGNQKMDVKQVDSYCKPVARLEETVEQFFDSLNEFWFNFLHSNRRMNL